MTRFGEVGWTSMSSEQPSNTGRTILFPTSLPIPQSKQKHRTTRKTATAATPRRHTRSMTTDAARKAVFNTPELLENIISFLPPAEILIKVRRLSRQWKSAVDSSPTVMNKLWMTSQKAPAVQSSGFTDEHIPGNPAWGQGARPMYNCALTLNSVLFGRVISDRESHALRLGLNDQSLSPLEFDEHEEVWSFPSILFDCYSTKSCHQTGPTMSPTWRKMYLTSPPITTVMLELHPSPSAFYGPDDIYLHLTNHTGITLGLLYDTIFASFGAQYGKTVASSEMEHFYASLHFVSASVSLGTDILVRE